MTATTPVPALGDWVCWRVFARTPVHIGRVCAQSSAKDYVVFTIEGDKVFLSQDMILAIVPSPIMAEV